jgi:hypothetical protein
MIADQFMKSVGIDGKVFTRNGPRMYVYRVRGRVAVMDSRSIDVTAFIDLSDYSVHVRTASKPEFHQLCESEAKRLRERLAPVARLARIARVKP